MRSRSMSGFAVACAVLALAQPLAAQTLRGRVLDVESGEPVMLAYVGLMAAEGEMVVAALATPEGVFEVTAPDGGSYFLYVSRTGYDTLVDGLFDIGDDGVMDVQIGLRPKPIEIDPLTVEAEVSRSPLEIEGFYDRALMGRGIFLVREDIERRAGQRVTDVFRGVPRLVIDESRPLTGPSAMQYPSLQILRNGELCSPTFYLDRHMIALGGATPVRPDDFVTAAELEAIEVYTRPSEVPVGFAELTDCGVVVMWTRIR